jgi:hypothetical protein
MFTGKILTKMAPHGLTFGEHCGDLEKNLKNVEPPEIQIYSENQHNVHEKCGLEDDRKNLKKKQEISQPTTSLSNPGKWKISWVKYLLTDYFLAINKKIICKVIVSNDAVVTAEILNMDRIRNSRRNR